MSYMHQYETKFMVTYSNDNMGYFIDNISFSNNTSFNCDIVPIFILIKTLKSGDALIIEHQKWRNIALISVCERNVDELLRYGAKISAHKFLFDDRIDATIQLAYVCSKYMISVEDVYIVTNGLLSPTTYNELLQKFYEDFPEKYI